MTPRIDIMANALGMKIAKRIFNVNLAIEQSPLPKTTGELVALRASQINGCGWCVDIHTKEAAADGESAVRLNLVAAWRHSTVFTEAERAASALAEEGTRLADASHGVSDDTWDHVRKHYDDDQIVGLVALIALINATTRLAVIVDQRGGSYEAGMMAGFATRRGGGPASDERGLLGQPEVGPGAGDDGLHVAPAGAAADRIGHPHHRVADLVDARRDGRVGAVGDVLAVDVQRAAPLAVMVAVEPEVQPDAEMDAGVAERLDRDRPGRAVGHREVQRAAEDAPVGGVVAQHPDPAPRSARRCRRVPRRCPRTDAPRSRTRWSRRYWWCIA